MKRPRFFDHFLGKSRRTAAENGAGRSVRCLWSNPGLGQRNASTSAPFQVLGAKRAGESRPVLPAHAGDRVRGLEWRTNALEWAWPARVAFARRFQGARRPGASKAGRRAAIGPRWLGTPKRRLLAATRHANLALAYPGAARSTLNCRRWSDSRGSPGRRGRGTRQRLRMRMRTMGKSAKLIESLVHRPIRSKAVGHRMAMATATCRLATQRLAPHRGKDLAVPTQIPDWRAGRPRARPRPWDGQPADEGRP